ncbi:Clp protease N-terminal domain-containing protein [Streptomyces sp. AM 2-1-1]|uniref:Clp protease N-terminal domain-containing protein n=1 Tax=Streptomyces sp. AM 2-1-1 TaxID=3028709 RepID=UPI0023B9FE16|nr:Clp protease N-terminal domain-containing protein [Streptomyces sp. AM 2-1-1]WEH39712.1 Clp protease N-terminal domain-containing protein [Streptomyces sp. AM 2-1-1]
MFERFTTEARAAVAGAVTYSRRTGEDHITEDHLLLSLLDQDAGRAAFALTALGVTDRRDSVEAALGEARRLGGLTKADTEALAGLGIDVGEIVARIEEEHGAGVLAEEGKGRRRRSGRRPLTAGAKRVLEGSLRIALGRGDRFIGGEHLLLALAARPGVVAEALADQGATYAAVEQALYGAGREGGGGAKTATG